ncbi:hypothetical protein F7725_003632 [Dissostichus mawsoni]|uniref:Uncharacterized protein n=1 Tax=Dissostichus mawsoni TaxID=36200 RepID=A0A7J5YAU7_DISMA|nr:hypothetical protein F7725_003632 [Dissostichus mawsoni]
MFPSTGVKCEQLTQPASCVCVCVSERGQKSSHQFSFNINMFSAALILLLAAGSCEELSVDSH